MPVQIVRSVAALRTALAAFRDARETVALIPTMGALHAGHLRLVEEGKARAARVVASIFVNPTQFGPNEDLSAYPRREAEDIAKLEGAACDLLWAPDAAAMYPAGFSSSIHVGGVTAGLEGVSRPGHFDGVATVVAKLFNQVRPDVALFGEKDFQQLAMVRRMVADLDFGIDIVGVPTVREGDGLALSSRNVYLDAGERVAAAALPRILAAAATAIAGGAPVAGAIDTARMALAEAGFGPIDYVALCDAATLQPIDRCAGETRLLVAAKLGRTRLIDNIPVTSCQT